MGHTVTSQRMIVDRLINELKDYGKALREEDREIYFRLIKKPLKRVGAISYTSSMHAWAFLILSILVEMEKNVVNRCLQEGEQNNFVDKD